MKLDKRDVQLYNVEVTLNEYPEVFVLAHYLREPYVVKMVEDQLNITVNNQNIIKSEVSRDRVMLRFLAETSYE